ARASDYPGLLTYSDNIRILDAIADNGLMSQEECRDLADIYREFRTEIHKAALQERSALVNASSVTRQRGRIGEIWQQYMLEDGP
ncbi:MAG: hypothetical protein PVJ39_15920, partial [Gammaproteobacteria bacterium]